jgi:hypothetical protein
MDAVNVHVDGPFVLNDMHLLIDAALHGAGLVIVMEDMAAATFDISQRVAKLGLATRIGSTAQPRLIGSRPRAWRRRSGAGRTA